MRFCVGGIAKVQSDSHWIICLGIVAFFRFSFLFLSPFFAELFYCCRCCMKVWQRIVAMWLMDLGSLYDTKNGQI